MSFGVMVNLFVCGGSCSSKHMLAASKPWCLVLGYLKELLRLDAGTFRTKQNFHLSIKTLKSVSLVANDGNSIFFSTYKIQKEGEYLFVLRVQIVVILVAT